MYKYKHRTMNLFGTDFEIDDIYSINDLYNIKCLDSSSGYTKTRVNINLRKHIHFPSTEIRMDCIETLRLSSSISFLGNCYQCTYCKCVIAPGVYNCYRCGSSQYEYIRNSKCYGFGYIEQVRIDSCSSYDAGTFLNINISLRSDMRYVLRDSKHTETLSTAHAEGWLCRYCHSIVEERDLDCPHCGSGRMAFSDIAKMNSKCLYCSSETENGVCKGCNSRRGAAPVWPNHYVL